MLPSPARRYSPGRELSVGKSHKRGRSVDCGLPYKSRDEDLSLFTDMQTKEKDNLMLLSNDDFEDSLAKLKCTPDYPFGLSVHVRARSNDLLHVDNEKSDYDWLLTPPDTPLFPYLDDDELPPTNLSVTRGRLQGQTMAIPRSSMAEKSQRSGRSSASPHRPSPSPRSSNSTTQSRGRSPSAQSSAAPALRPTTPSRRSPTPIKPSSPTPRSSTPTFRRMSVDSGLQASSSGRRGSSPMKGSRGSSASPKLQGWQPSIPVYSSDAPPNLRTSLSDRPSSYSRGSSPASRNGRSRQSMSPTASRSASSSHSHDLDRSSPHSKDSATSFADEDLDSLPSISRGISSSPVTRKNGGFVSNKSMGFSRRPSKTTINNSTPKRSLDSTLREMEQHKTPQNMFRPLLSSAPISSFYIGKANATHRPIFSRNSSLTTSSNASSEFGVSVAPEFEVSERETAYDAGEWDKVSDSLLHEEGFAFEKMDEIKEDFMHDLVSETMSLGGHEDFDVNIAKDIELNVERSHSPIEFAIHSQEGSSHDQPCQIENNIYKKMCSVCKKMFTFAEVGNSVVSVCKECANKTELSGTVSVRDHLLISQEESVSPKMMSDVTDVSCHEPQLVVCPEISNDTDINMNCQPRGGAEQMCSHLGNSPNAIGCLQEDSVHLGTYDQRYDKPLEIHQPMDKLVLKQNFTLQLTSRESDQLHHEVTGEQMVDQLANDNRYLHPQPTGSNLSLNLDSTEGTGISLLLLKRSSSNKGALVQTRAFIASSTQYDEPTYARESIDIVRSSISRNSSSASSSLDMGTVRQTEAHTYLQSCARKIEADNQTSELNRIPHISISSPVNAIKTGENSGDDPGHDNFPEREKNNEKGLSEHNSVGKNDDTQSSEDAECNHAHFSSTTVIFAGESSCTESSVQIDGYSLSQSPPKAGACKIDRSPGLIASDHNFLSQDDAEVEKPRCSFADKDEYVNNDLHVGFHNDEGNSDSTHLSSSSTTADTHTCERTECMEIENEDYQNCAADADLFESQSFSSASEKELSYQEEISATESSNMIEGSPKQQPESSTATEVSDAILFCSSIVHDLVYKAATIAIEKEESYVSKFAQPSVSIPDKPVSHQTEQTRVRNRHTTKSQPVKRNLTETDVVMHDLEPLKSEKLHDSLEADPIPRHQIDTPKAPSKCNCAIM